MKPRAPEPAVRTIHWLFGHGMHKQTGGRKVLSRNKDVARRVGHDSHGPDAAVEREPHAQMPDASGLLHGA
jgi:hypothetical protein